ncbi:MAG TPA: hypothetical protein VMV09_06925, partial [Candidatus Saccharimonadales bacterium]|nr:hypothetical protein [Candidatus Saccharimonadales bacterium]
MTVSGTGGPPPAGPAPGQPWPFASTIPVTPRPGRALGPRELPREAICLTAVALLGLGASLSDGFYSVAGLLLVVLGVVLTLLIRFGKPSHAPGLVWSATILVGAMATAFLYGGSPLVWLACTAGGGAAVMVVLSRRRLPRAAAAVVSGSIWLVLLGLNVGWGAAPIDVVLFIRGATSKLLAGTNPYAASYASTTPGLASSHYPYGPGVLLLSIPGRLLGDVRLSDLLAVLVLVAA